MVSGRALCVHAMVAAISSGVSLAADLPVRKAEEWYDPLAVIREMLPDGYSVLPIRQDEWLDARFGPVNACRWQSAYISRIRYCRRSARLCPGKDVWSCEVVFHGLSAASKRLEGCGPWHQEHQCLSQSFLSREAGSMHDRTHFEHSPAWQVMSPWWSGEP
jgi:hypothetical protein